MDRNFRVLTTGLQIMHIKKQGPEMVYNRPIRLPVYRESFLSASLHSNSNSLIYEKEKLGKTSLQKSKKKAVSRGNESFTIKIGIVSQNQLENML